MYVAVKGGDAAIEAAHGWLAAGRRGDPSLPELNVTQIEQQLTLAVDRVMAEGSCYDRGLAALAIKQARGDLIEAAFLLRAYRNTLTRFTPSEPLDTGRMRIWRRISATYKDLPGGQVLGPTFDYTHRLLDFALAAEGGVPPAPEQAEASGAPMPRVSAMWISRASWKNSAASARAGRRSVPAKAVRRRRSDPPLIAAGRRRRRRRAPEA
jgi:alpha-D-ribose 1-methylphosphonate 5-triphosphate synthase subunit PhnI